MSETASPPDWCANRAALRSVPALWRATCIGACWPQVGGWGVPEGLNPTGRPEAQGERRAAGTWHSGDRRLPEDVGPAIYAAWEAAVLPLNYARSRTTCTDEIG